MKNKVILLITSFAFIAASAQDMHFSQFYNTPLLVNPSLAGNDDGTFQGMLNYRSQWNNTYQTFGLSLDGGLMKKIDKGFLGLGGAVFNDTQGDAGLNRLNAKFSVAYHNQISRQQYFTAGISGGVSQKSIDRSKLIWDDQYDGTSSGPNLVSNATLFNPNVLSPDFSLGFNYLFKENEYVGKRRFLLGGAVHNLVNVDDAFIDATGERRNFRYVIHSEASLPIRGTNIEIQPSGMFSLQGTSEELLMGVNVRYELKEESKFTDFSKTNAVTIGVFARQLKSIVAYAGLQLDKYNIGINYDLGINPNNPIRGAFELSIKYINLTKFNNVYTPAPRL